MHKALPEPRFSFFPLETTFSRLHFVNFQKTQKIASCFSFPAAGARLQGLALHVVWEHWPHPLHLCVDIYGDAF